MLLSDTEKIELSDNINFIPLWMHPNISTVSFYAPIFWDLKLCMFQSFLA